eukprot:g2501.t1
MIDLFGSHTCRVQLLDESDQRHGAYDFYAEQIAAPDDLKQLTDQYESLPFRRRGYDALLQSVIERAGYEDLVAEQQDEKQEQPLAPLPKAISHFDLDRLHDRPVQAALVETLLVPRGDERFTSCVLVHGMGGTGKTVTAVASVQDKGVRGHYSAIYWLTVGADALGSQLKHLQAQLFKQLTGKDTKAEEKDEHKWLQALVVAMAGKKRALVVLDDPWMPEQVRFLNPIDGTQLEHRLLVTTRIRDLVPKATRLELPLMGKEEAVNLLLDLAGVDQATYLKERPESPWPPEEAFAIAAECGLLPMTLTIAAQVVR